MANRAPLVLAGGQLQQMPTGDTVALAAGGTGATNAAGARSALGLGSIATQAASAVSITGGSIDGAPIGANAKASVACTTLTATGISALYGGAAIPGYLEYRLSSGARYGYTGFWDGGTNLVMVAEQGWGWRLSGAAFVVDPPLTGTTIKATTKVTNATCTIATLPTSPVAGDQIYVTNMRVFTSMGTLESSGSGTGGLATYTGSQWRVAGTSQQALA